MFGLLELDQVLTRDAAAELAKAIMRVAQRLPGPLDPCRNQLAWGKANALLKVDRDAHVAY